MTNHSGEICIETNAQSWDSDYGTWSSASSDQYSEIKTNSIPGVSNDYTSMSPCCLNYNQILGASNDQRRSRWRGIRMGITIDYNVIKSYGERYEKRPATDAEIAESVDSDNVKRLDTSLETADKPSARPAAEKFTTNTEWMPNYPSSPLVTEVKNQESDYLNSDTNDDTFRRLSTSSESNVTLTGNKLSQEIPQDIINNVKRQILNEVFFGESEDETEPIFQRQNDRSSEGIVSRFMIDLLDNDVLNSEQDILRANAIMLVYSITDKKSFSDVNTYYRAVMTAKKHMHPVVLVATKTDVEKKKRKVTAFEGQTLARRFNCPFIEVSAKTNEQVHQAFVELMRLVDKQYARIRRFKRSLAPLLL
uniref:small monomeric GTPase n=1 Tax=Syphacia muris TaxID=451379 RepID=A0A0N5ALK9_9BILA